MGDDDVRALSIVMEEARRLLVRQEADLDTLRGRVATIVAASSVVAAVFGAALPKHRSDFSFGCSITALLFFVATVFVCLYILKPRSWDFSQNLGPWTERLKEGSDAPTERVVALGFLQNFQEFRVNNRTQLEGLQWWQTWALIYLAAQVVAWILAIL